jgi:hypothetical protein
MNQQLFQQAVQKTLAELRAMSPEEFRAEIAKHRNSDISNLFAIAREFDDNFMRFPPRGEPTSCRAKPASEGSVLPGGVTEEMVENWVSRIVEGHLAKVLPKLVEEVLSRKLEQEGKILGN